MTYKKYAFEAREEKVRVEIVSRKFMVSWKVQILRSFHNGVDKLEVHGL